MSAIPKQQYAEYYKEQEQQRYRDFIHSLSNDISFESDTWICEKRLKNQAQHLSKITIYFSKVPARYKEMVKYYAAIRLLEGKGVSTVCGDIGNVAVFLNFMGNIPLSEISVLTVSRFKECLDAKEYSECSRSNFWSDVGTFLGRMNGFDGMTLKNPFYDNPYQSKRLVDQKYIPEYVSKQLEKFFYRRIFL